MTTPAITTAPARPVHQKCPHCGSTNVDFGSTPGLMWRRSEWECLDCDGPSWTGADLTMAVVEDDDGDGLGAALNTAGDRVTVIANAYGITKTVPLTPADTRIYAARLLELADEAERGQP